MDGQSRGDGDGRTTVCVLWCEPGGAAPPDLVGALARRGVRTVEVHDRFEALAELTLGTGGRHVATGGAERAVVCVLIEPVRLVKPDELVRAMAVHAPRVTPWIYEAHSRPPLRVAGSADPGLRHATGGPSEPTTASGPVPEVKNTPVVTAVPGTAGGERAGGAPGPGTQREGAARGRDGRPGGIPGPRLRLTGGPEVQGTAPRADEVLGPEQIGSGEQVESDSRSSTMRGLLTGEELAMLLSDEGPDRPERP